MNDTNPIISVVCPAYNSSTFIGKTLQSLVAQTQLSFEVVVSDDGSSDNTVAVVEQFAHEHPQLNIVIVRNPHKGPGAARNAAIRAATGEWIAFLDSDDACEPYKIEHVTQAIKQYPDINFFCHDQYHQFRDGRVERLDLAKRYAGMNLRKQLFKSSPFATSAVVCKRSVLKEHGLFNEHLLSAQDYELWLRLSPHLRVRHIDEPLGWYIDRPGNISSKKRWRHLRNELWALWHNRRNTTWHWLVLGIAHHLAVFVKGRLRHMLDRMRV